MTEEELGHIVFDCGENMVKAGDPNWSCNALLSSSSDNAYHKVLEVMMHRELCFPTLLVVPDGLEVRFPSLPLPLTQLSE